MLFIWVVCYLLFVEICVLLVSLSAFDVRCVLLVGAVCRRVLFIVFVCCFLLVDFLKNVVGCRCVCWLVVVGCCDVLVVVVCGVLLSCVDDRCLLFRAVGIAVVCWLFVVAVVVCCCFCLSLLFVVCCLL